MRILVLVDSSAAASTAVAVGQALRSELAADIWILVVSPAPHQVEFPPEFTIYYRREPSEWQTGHPAEDPVGSRPREPGIQSDGRKVSARLALLAIQFLRRFHIIRDLRASLSTWSFFRRIKLFLEFARPDEILVFEDNIETLSRILVAVGDRMGTPSIVLPYTIPNPLEPATPLIANGERCIGKLVEGAFSVFKSRWVLHLQGKRLLRLPAIRAISMEMMGLSVPQPWVLNSGSARAIALDSDVARQRYLELGFPSDQLEVVGDPVGGILKAGLACKRELRRRLCEENKLDSSDRALVICAFPPDQYRGTETGSYEAPSFRELIAMWIDVLQDISQQANILIRPHPRLHPEQLKRHETPHLRVSVQPTAELVPAADLYVASISATIRWAIACGVPVINYDCYRYRYDDYRTASGVITVYSQEEFRDALRRYFSDASFAAELKERQQSVMTSWGIIDDGFAARFSRLVRRVARASDRAV